MIVGEGNGHLTAAQGETADRFPCTLLQEHLWARHKRLGPSGLNVAMRWAVQGELPRVVAEGALQSLVRRHEILRTRFREANGGLEQLVSPSGALKLLYVDLSFLPPDESAARAEQMSQTEAVESMDPQQGPLMRATLLRFGQGRGMLLLTLHAMVADGWSTGLLISEFRAAARAIGSGTPADGPEPELQFVDYALWQRELLASGALDEARAFWRRQLADAVGTRVPPDRQSASEGAGKGSITSILLPTGTSEAIDSFARLQGTTRFGVAAAGLALMLHRVTGDREIVFGSQVANREEPAAEALIGPTTNSITLRLPVRTDVALFPFVRSVADIVQQALQHQRLPFELTEPAHAARDGRPLHAINLVVHRSYSGTEETEKGTSGRFSLVSLPSYSSGPLWDLNFFLIGRDEGWRLSCESNAEMYEPGTVQSLLESWQECLQGIVTTADCRLADCPWLAGSTARVETTRPTAPEPRLQRHEPPAFGDPARHIVRFHEAGPSTPVIVLNNRSVYFHLADALGEDRPFTDIQLYHPSDSPDHQAQSFEAFAASAVRLIRWAQPRGPYVLGGHCVYGALAFEAARQLGAMGEKTVLVALFDTWAPGYREDMSPFDRKVRELQIGTRERIKRLGEYRKGEVGLDAIVTKPILRRLGLLRPEAAPEKSPDLLFDDRVTDAAKSYRPQPYEGDVVLFRSQETLRGRLFDELMGWRPLVSGNLVKVEVDSGHQDMFRERPARAIAAVLRAKLVATAEG